MLKNGERIEDLKYKGLRIIRPPGGFTYGTDSVLLAGLSRAGRKESVVELCSGAGAIALLFGARTGARVIAVELRADLSDAAARSVRMNGLKNVEALQMDLRDAPRLIGYGGFDAAVCNPPYFSGGTRSPDEIRRMSAHQENGVLDDVAQCAFRLLKNGGRFYMVYPASLIAGAFASLTGNGLEPKRIRFISHREGKAPYLLFIEAKKLGGRGAIIEPNLYLTDINGDKTEEIKRIYHEQ